MAMIDVFPYVLYVFHQFPESRQGKTSKSFMSIFKLFRENNGRAELFENSYPCLLMLISFCLVPQSISKQVKAK